MILAVRSGGGQNPTQPYLILRKYIAQFSQLAMCRVCSKFSLQLLNSHSVLKGSSLHPGASMKRAELRSPVRSPGLRGLRSCRACSAALGQARTTLVLPQRNPVWKSYQRSRSPFLSTHRVLYSMWPQEGAFDITGRMSGGEDEGTWEKSSWTPQELNP